MTDRQYIELHLTDDVRRLALGNIPPGVDIKWCLQQIEGQQIAQRKLPSWARIRELWYPPRLPLEQCSGEAAALYKQRVVEQLLPNGSDRQSFADLSGGMGVDCSFLAPLFDRSQYYERQEELCRLALHNFPLLGLKDVEVINDDTVLSQEWRSHHYSLIFLDPARRSDAGRKTVALADCSPDVVALQAELFAHAPFIMLKLSPMLDISMALRQLHHVSQVHVVSVRGECKELLLILRQGSRPEGVSIHCVNLDTDDPPVESQASEVSTTLVEYTDNVSTYLYEPNASLLKGGVHDVVAARNNLLKLGNHSNLYTSSACVAHYPGRVFRVEAWSRFGKRELRDLLGTEQQANITVRNFPASVAELRKRLRLREGGELYLFATTLTDGTHILIKCRKV